FAQSTERVETPLNDGEWETFEALKISGGVEKLKQQLAKTLQEFHSVGVLDRLKASIPRSEIALRKGTQEEIVPVAHLYDHKDVQVLLDQRLTSLDRSDSTLRALAYKIGITLFEPNIRFNEAATRQATEAAISVVSRTSGVVQ